MFYARTIPPLSLVTVRYVKLMVSDIYQNKLLLVLLILSTLPIAYCHHCHLEDGGIMFPHNIHICLHVHTVSLYGRQPLRQIFVFHVTVGYDYMMRLNLPEYFEILYPEARMSDFRTLGILLFFCKNYFKNVWSIIFWTSFMHFQPSNL